MENESSGSLAHSVRGLAAYLYRLDTLSISIGIFLILLAVFKGLSAYGIFGTRLILFGFGLQYWRSSVWKSFQRVVAILFLIASFASPKYFLAVYEYLK